jgi:hypothetical protein
MDKLKWWFTEIFNSGLFGMAESRSGPGSTLERTGSIRKALPALLKELSVKTLLDAPCGDWYWMRSVDLTGLVYFGLDIVDQAIHENNQRYAKKDVVFEVADITVDPLHKADLILCRDCLVHLSYEDVFKALFNFKQSGSVYLLTTTFPSVSENYDLRAGEIWRALNLERPPFNLTKPLQYIVEEFDEVFGAKSLGLWNLDLIN